MDRFEYRSGRLYCEDVEATRLADDFGTPLYVYSESTLVDHYDRIATAFSTLDPLICYSIKSCANLAVCRTLVRRGAGMDVVSGGELERAWLAGCPMNKIVYAGVGKTDAEIRAALDGRHSLLHDPHAHERGPIGWFNVESEQEFETIAAIAREMGARARGALRVNPDVDPRTHVYTSTGKKETKFGVDLERAVRFFERYGRNNHLHLDALHLHIGSPVYDTAPYVEAIMRTLALIDDLASRGFVIRTLDLGGGFGADYETSRSPLAADYAAAIAPLLAPRVERGLNIILEPGRTISANAGVLLARVLFVKEGGSKRFVITDAGMHTLIRPAFYGAFHFIWPAEVEQRFVPPRRSETLDLPGLLPCDVVGPICESGDFLAKGRNLPPVSRGDVLAVFTAGAYGMVMASTYNTQPLPAEVMVSGTEARLVRRRQTVKELLANEE